LSSAPAHKITPSAWGFLVKVDPPGPNRSRDWLLEHVWSHTDIARVLGVSRTTVGSIIHNSPYATDFIPGPWRKGKLYSRACLAYVYDHTAKARAAPLISSHWIPTVTVRTELNIALSITLHNFDRQFPEWQLGPFELRRLRGKPGRVEVMKRAAYQRLKEVLPPLAPPDWITSSKLTQLTGRPRSQVEAHLANADSRLYRTSTGQIAPHFHFDDAQALLRSARPRAAGDWLTIHALAGRLKQSPDWVGARVNQSLAQIRLDDRHRPGIHYPPREEDRLRALRPQPAGDWLTAQSLADRLERGVPWVRTHINRELAEVRLDIRGQPAIHYPPQEEARLRPLAAAARKSSRFRRPVVDEGEPVYPAGVRREDLTAELQAAFPYTAADFAHAGEVTLAQAHNWLCRYRTRQTTLMVTNGQGRTYRYNEVLFQAWLSRHQSTKSPPERMG
jgi:hypothetical protein